MLTFLKDRAVRTWQIFDAMEGAGDAQDQAARSLFMRIGKLESDLGALRGPLNEELPASATLHDQN